jgi:hypothetical protein
LLVSGSKLRATFFLSYSAVHVPTPTQHRFALT